MMRAAYLWRSSDCLLFIVVAVVAVTCTVSEEIQNTTSSFSYAWQSDDDDVTDELGRADRFDDTLFQPDLRLTVELVRSNGFGLCAARRPDCAQTRVRTRAPPTGADQVDIVISAPAAYSRSPAEHLAQRPERDLPDSKCGNGLCRLGFSGRKRRSVGSQRRAVVWRGSQPLVLARLLKRGVGCDLEREGE